GFAGLVVVVVAVCLGVAAFPRAAVTVEEDAGALCGEGVGDGGADAVRIVGAGNEGDFVLEVGVDHGESIADWTADGRRRGWDADVHDFHDFLTTYMPVLCVLFCGLQSAVRGLRSIFSTNPVSSRSIDFVQ